MYGHWITIIAVLTAGLCEPSLFGIGYLASAFWMLWRGNKLYLMNHYHQTIKIWETLLYYNVLIMFCKICLQVNYLLL